jgi:hypothetical protein
MHALHSRSKVRRTLVNASKLCLWALHCGAMAKRVRLAMNCQKFHALDAIACRLVSAHGRDIPRVVDSQQGSGAIAWRQQV